MKGLEIGCLAFIDVAAATALHAAAVQTPSSKELKAKGKTMVNHYVEVIEKHIQEIKSVTRYLAADGYFMNVYFSIIQFTPATATLLFSFKQIHQVGIAACLGYNM